jgi:hypothetical protein
MTLRKRDTVEDILSLDLAELRRQGSLDHGANSAWFSWTWTRGARRRTARLWLDDDELEIEMEGAHEVVDLTWTEAGWGGQRRWFSCPACGQRCRVIYRLNRRWRCRCCCALTYPSQYEDESDRIYRQVRRLLRAHFDPDEMPANPLDRKQFPAKPRWMHWSTYFQVQARHRSLVEHWMTTVAGKFNLTLPGARATA